MFIILYNALIKSREGKFSITRILAKQVTEDKVYNELLSQIKRAEKIALASDRLIKALITLLAIENKPLLDNLETIFAIARAQNNPVGDISADVWGEINYELKIIRQLVDDDGPIN